MNLDHIFEDLEAQFDGYLTATQPRHFFGRSQVLRVWHQRASITELAAPILGKDFVAGMALGSNVFKLIRLEAVSKISMIELVNSGVPTSRFVPIGILDFLERLPLPFSIRLQPLGDKLSANFVVLDFLGEAMLVESGEPESILLLPFAGMAHLDLIDVENFDIQS